MSGAEDAVEEVESGSEEEVKPKASKPDAAIGLTMGKKRRARKEKYCIRFVSLLNEYKSILLINIDNVGSNQMAEVRMSLRGRAVFLMGKNTLVRRILKLESDKNPQVACLIPHIVGNVGLVFTNEDLIEIRTAITTHQVPAAAKTGALAPVHVYVPPGPTGMDPGQTSFFQALNIATKIMRGCIEIINKVHLIVKGEKVTASHVSLLTKLGIKPFFYGIKVLKVYEDGDVFNANVLDFSDELIMCKFFGAVRKLAAITMACGYPNAASLPHLVTNALKPLVAIALETDYMFEQAEIYKDMIENPDKYGGGAGAGAGGDDAKADDAAPEEAAPEEEEEESEGGLGGGGGLFGDDSDAGSDY